MGERLGDEPGARRAPARAVVAPCHPAVPAEGTIMTLVAVNAPLGPGWMNRRVRALRDGRVDPPAPRRRACPPGLTNRGRRGKPPVPVTWQQLAKVLANAVCVGIGEWNGVQHPGAHEPLVGPGRQSGRRLSIQNSKGHYTYFFCLGQKNDPAGTCREPCVPADDLEAQVEELCSRIWLPESSAERLREEMDAELVERQPAGAGLRRHLQRVRARIRNTSGPT